jgi:hypothetical protein
MKGKCVVLRVIDITTMRRKYVDKFNHTIQLGMKLSWPVS